VTATNSFRIEAISGTCLRHSLYSLHQDGRLAGLTWITRAPVQVPGAGGCFRTIANYMLLHFRA